MKNSQCKLNPETKNVHRQLLTWFVLYKRSRQREAGKNTLLIAIVISLQIIHVQEGDTWQKCFIVNYSIRFCLRRWLSWQVFFLFAKAAEDWYQKIHSSATSFEFEKHSKNSLGEFSLRYYFLIKTRRFFGDYFASLARKQVSFSRKWRVDTCGLFQSCFLCLLYAFFPWKSVRR